MLEVRLTGKFDIKCDGKPVIISSRIAQSLFASLILTAGTIHRREKLAGMFWPEATEQKARAYLRHELWRIRKSVPSSEFLVSDALGITFDPSLEYWLDAQALEKLSDLASADELMAALSAYQGELLPGFYDEWIILQREHLQAVYEQKMARLLEFLESEKRWPEILKWAGRWIAFGHGPEVAYRYLMIAYDALEDHAKMISTYERCVQALRELELEPSEQTRALAFKRSSKLNIPIPLTSFIGREKELKEVAALFSKSRLVTLTGSGGIGKTRLSIQVVADVLDMFPDGVWFLDLTTLTDPILVPNALVSLLGLYESGDTKLPVTDLLMNYFHSRKALVIFDNCEHLIKSCARLVDSLLTACKNLSVLATSREALRVSGEIPYRVPSLEIPRRKDQHAIDALANIESVRLFAGRAEVVSPGFALNLQNAPVIAQICQRLDGIPLAIELAAARVNVLTTQQILKRLDDRFNLLRHGTRTAVPRHQTLRATIDWSYDLLSEQERLLFRRLAVFKGGWTLESAKEVCSQNFIDPNKVFDLLSQLVNKSLVMVAEHLPSEEAPYPTGGSLRYRRLETIRQYAWDRLVESGEEESIRTRHLEYFLQLADQAESALRGPAQRKWYARLNDERDNLRAALEWADKTDLEAGLYLSGRLHRFWESLDFREGGYWLSKFLQKPESYQYPRARAKALQVYGWILDALQQSDAARSPAKECLELYRATGDQHGEVDGLLLLAWVSSNATQKRELNQQALALAQSLGDVSRQVSAFWQSGWLYQGRKGLFHWKKAIALARPLGDWRWLASSLSTVGFFLILNGDIESAQTYLDEANILYQQLNLNPPPAHLLSAYGKIALIEGDFEKARAYLQEGIRINVEFGGRQGYLWARARLGYVALREGNFTEAALYFSETVQSFQQDNYEIGVVYALEGIASLFVAADKPEHAARLIGWADATREKICDTRPIVEQADVDRDTTAIIVKIGSAAFDKAYKLGGIMTLDEAVAAALEEL